MPLKSVSKLHRGEDAASSFTLERKEGVLVRSPSTLYTALPHQGIYNYKKSRHYDQFPPLLYYQKVIARKVLIPYQVQII